MSTQPFINTHKQAPYWNTKFVSFFDVDKDVISVTLSTIGLGETVSVNGKKVSQQASSGSHSKHAFEIDGIQYEVLITVKDSFKGPFTVELYREDICIDSDVWRFPDYARFALPLLSFAAGAALTFFVFTIMTAG